MAGATSVDKDSLQPILDKFEALQRQITIMQRPTGTSTAGLYDQVQAALATIGPAVTAFLSGGFTTSSMVASGNISIGGYLYTPAGYAYDITYTRRTAWLGSDGRLGWASSSITAKEIVDTLEQPDVLAILEITSYYYERKAEIAKRDDPESPDYRGPAYHVALEWGAIAEQLDDLGLWQAVIYEWDLEYDLVDVLDDDGNPSLNDQGYHLKERVGEPRRMGEPRPVGIHYELLGLLAIRATRFVWGEHLELKNEVAELRRVIAG